jgi:hypothetical protein
MHRSPKFRPGNRAAAFIALILAAIVLTIIGPFALAGATHNPLWIAVPVFLTLLYVAAREAPRCLAFYRSLWPRDWLPALGYAAIALVVTSGVALLLSAAPAASPLNWSLGNAFNVGGDAGMNGFTIPFTNPLLAIIYAPASLLALPLLAWIEEDLFRRGTTGVASATRRSALFGIMHLTAGVTLGACIALACAGYIFTIVYWRALRDSHRQSRTANLPRWVQTRLFPVNNGNRVDQQYATYRSTQAHLVYNAIGVCAILLLSI